MVNKWPLCLYENRYISHTAVSIYDRMAEDNDAGVPRPVLPHLCLRQRESHFAHFAMRQLYINRVTVFPTNVLLDVFSTPALS